jgi:hypothetical protein
MFIARLLVVSSLSILNALSLHASCCSSSSSLGIGRLLLYERAYLEYATNARFAYGSFNNKGTYSLGLDAQKRSLRLGHEINAMARLAPFLLPFIKIPAHIFISKEEHYSYLGSIAFGFRFVIIPSLNLLSALQLPHRREPLFLSQGLSLDQSFGDVIMTISYALSFDPAIMTRRRYKRGIKHLASLQSTFLINTYNKITLSSIFNYNSSSSVDNKHIKYTSAYDLALSTSYAWSFHSHLSLMLSIGVHIPLSYMGKNTPSELFSQVALRAGIF